MDTVSVEGRAEDSTGSCFSLLPEASILKWKKGLLHSLEVKAESFAGKSKHFALASNR